MINNLMHTLLLRRHFWRYASFSEIAELYTSELLRKVAIGMAASFMSVYLYQHGYGVAFIAGFWSIYFFVKTFLAIPTSWYAAQFGPKHGILLANLLYIPAMIIFAMVPTWGLSAIIFSGLFQALSATLYSLCYAVDFSKIKNVQHAGKEIGYMSILEKLARGISPLIGGFLAYLIAPSAALYAAAILFGLAALPLLTTSEPVKTHQKIKWRNFPWKLTYRNIAANVGAGFDYMATASVWTLYIAVAIVGFSGSNKVYAIIGVLSSVALFSSVISAYVYGRLIDKQKGDLLLKTGVIGVALIHITRPFVQTVPIAGAINVADDIATTGYKMAFTRGVFDTADRSGHRIVYLSLMEIAMNFGSSVAALLLWVFVITLSEVNGMKALFFVTGAMVLILLTTKFRLYQK